VRLGSDTEQAKHHDEEHRNVPGYNFSPALKAANITWDEQTLDKFLENPGTDIHGTKMFVSVPNAQNRQNIIAYLETLKP
jgi:cytochrome c